MQMICKSRFSDQGELYVDISKKWNPFSLYRMPHCQEKALQATWLANRQLDIAWLCPGKEVFWVMVEYSWLGKLWNSRASELQVATTSFSAAHAGGLWPVSIWREQESAEPGWVPSRSPQTIITHTVVQRNNYKYFGQIGFSHLLHFLHAPGPWASK